MAEDHRVDSNDHALPAERLTEQQSDASLDAESVTVSDADQLRLKSADAFSRMHRVHSRACDSVSRLHQLTEGLEAKWDENDAAYQRMQTTDDQRITQAQEKLDVLERAIFGSLEIDEPNLSRQFSMLVAHERHKWSWISYCVRFVSYFASRIFRPLEPVNADSKARRRRRRSRIGESRPTTIGRTKSSSSISSLHRAAFSGDFSGLLDPGPGLESDSSGLLVLGREPRNGNHHPRLARADGGPNRRHSMDESADFWKKCNDRRLIKDVG